MNPPGPNIKVVWADAVVVLLMWFQVVTHPAVTIARMNRPGLNIKVVWEDVVVQSKL